jgi:hypothetical protein
MDDKFYGINFPEENIVFKSGQTEMLRVAPDGFYIRGIKVEQGPEEAKAVYNTIKQIITWDTLKR